MSAVDQQRAGRHRRGHRRAGRRRAGRSGRDGPPAEGRRSSRELDRLAADPARRAGRTALSPVPFARRVRRARGPGTDAARSPRVPAWPTACGACSKPASGRSRRRCPSGGATSHPPARTSSPCPTRARPATERPPSDRPTTRASPASRSRSCRRSSRSCSASGLGELEVREGDWRIRLRRSAPARPAPPRRTDRPRLGAPRRPRRPRPRGPVAPRRSRPRRSTRRPRGIRRQPAADGRDLARRRRVPGRGRRRRPGPRRRPDRERRPAGDRPGRDRRRSTGRWSRCSPRPARPSSTARRSRPWRPT